MYHNYISYVGYKVLPIVLLLLLYIKLYYIYVWKLQPQLYDLC